MSFRNVRIAALGALAIVAGPAMAKPGDEERLQRMLAGESAMQGKDLENAIQKAEASPLGSARNPVRVSMPAGQHAYLGRLRCSDGQPPAFNRAGNVGPGPYYNVVDLYLVRCAGGEPRETEVRMDMYHRGHDEDRPVPGFTMAQ